MAAARSCRRALPSAAGVPEWTVRAILGHGSAAMTRRYLHVLPTMLTDAGARLDAFFTAAAAGS
jgi:integrase